MRLPRLVLASASPRRTEILTRLGIAHEVFPASIDETERPGEAPLPHVERLAVEKADAVALVRPDRWVLAGDTVVILDGKVLGKPRDQAHAVEILMGLSGREHHVASALALRAPREQGKGLWSGVEVTSVTFRAFDRGLAEGYAATGEPLDKAGAYGIQGAGAALVEKVEGDYSGVVGLPVSLLVRLMGKAGIPYRFSVPDPITRTRSPARSSEPPGGARP